MALSLIQYCALVTRLTAPFGPQHTEVESYTSELELGFFGTELQLVPSSIAERVMQDRAASSPADFQPAVAFTVGIMRFLSS